MMERRRFRSSRQPFSVAVACWPRARIFPGGRSPPTDALVPLVGDSASAIGPPTGIEEACRGAAATGWVVLTESATYLELCR